MAEQLGGVRLTDDETVVVSVLVRIGIEHLARSNGTVAPNVRALGDQLARFARRTLLVQAAAVGEPASLPGGGAAAESVPLLDGQIGVTAAAGRTGYSAQHVRRLCHRGVLIAFKTSAGAWLIDDSSAAALAARKGRTP